MEGLIWVHNNLHGIDWLNTFAKIITFLGDFGFIIIWLSFGKIEIFQLLHIARHGSFKVYRFGSCVVSKPRGQIKIKGFRVQSVSVYVLAFLSVHIVTHDRMPKRSKMNAKLMRATALREYLDLGASVAS